MSGNVLLFVGIGSMILIFVLDRFFDIDAITFVTVIVISVAMVIFSLLINPSNSDSTIEKNMKNRGIHASIFLSLYHKSNQKSISYVILKTKNLIDTIHYVV